MKLLTDTDVKGKYVVARLDLDDPIGPGGGLESDFRIRASLRTLEYLKSHGAKRIVVVTKLGRPVTRVRERMERIIAGNARLSVAPVAHRMREILGNPVDKLTRREIEQFPLPGYVIDRGIILLENSRFDWRETANDRSFATELAALGDLYVFDAFAMAHRAEASTVGIAGQIELVAGLQMTDEVETLERLTKSITGPFVCVLGGAKLETKLPVIARLLPRVDTFLLGGVMANTFAKASGEEDVKRSVVGSETEVALAAKLLKKARKKFLLPKDYLWHTGKIMDIGPESRTQFAAEIARAKTVFWNGTMGVTSLSAQDFKFGTLDVARALADNREALAVVSGGDTVGVLMDEEVDLGKFSFVSTGGGSTLKFLAGDELPVLRALDYYTAEH